MALAAYGGGVGMAGNSNLFGPLQARVGSRLPFHSFVLAAVALSVVVGVPMTLAAVASWRGHRRAGTLVVAAGSCLVAWIIVEFAIVRVYFWLQPACIVYALVMIVLGLRIRPDDPPQA